MSIWYSLCELLPIGMLRWDFMKNAFLAVVLINAVLGVMQESKAEKALDRRSGLKISGTELAQTGCRKTDAGVQAIIPAKG